jgi:single-stranded-DNA-specific exonuclease
MSNKKWEILNNSELITQNSQLAIEALIRLVLKNRGIGAEKDVDTFINPRLEDVTIESVGLDLQQVRKTIERIQSAIKDKEQIIVFGDYDVDGITASAILWETLRSLDAKVMPYIPNRIEEGYGLSEMGLDGVLKLYPETTLIITVDNGIVAHKAVDYARKKGIDVIITDHHVPHGDTKLEYPRAYAIVHTTALCGAGVAYMLSKYCKEQIAQSTYTFDDDKHLELATLGTIADLVPLTGANRTIVKFGLKKLCETKRLGLLEIFKQAACDSTGLGVYEVGHIIAPRLNAAGRLASAMDSLRLLCTTNQKRAQELAALLDKTNKERQQIMHDHASHASSHFRTLTDPMKKLLFIADETYQQGVIGLVAGRLVEEYYRPAIVISKGEKFSKASVRSVSGFNIIQFLRQASDLLVDVGGHPMAAGFTVETEKIDVLQKRLEEMAETAVGDDHLLRRVRIDCELPLHLVTEQFYQQLLTLAPFGMGNPEPTFVSRGLMIEDMRFVGKQQQHIKFRLSSDFVQFDAIAFGVGDRGRELQIEEKIDMAYTVEENTWNNRTTLQLKVKDFKRQQ